MPLRDRRCTNCQNQAEDLLETGYEELIECPVCHEKSFINVFRAGSFRMEGPDSHHSFHRAVDASRGKAAAGHGNASYRM